MENWSFWHCLGEMLSQAARASSSSSSSAASSSSLTSGSVLLLMRFSSIARLQHQPAPAEGYKWSGHDQGNNRNNYLLEVSTKFRRNYICIMQFLLKVPTSSFTLY